MVTPAAQSHAALGGKDWHAPQSTTSPQPSDTTPHDAPSSSQLLGIHGFEPQVLIPPPPQTEPEGHWPQSRTPPQPSGALPHVAPACAQVLAEQATGPLSAPGEPAEPAEPAEPLAPTESADEHAATAAAAARMHARARRSIMGIAVEASGSDPSICRHSTRQRQGGATPGNGRVDACVDVERTVVACVCTGERKLTLRSLCTSERPSGRRHPGLTPV